MAESVISSVTEKLCSLLIEEISTLGGVHDEVEQIEGELRMIQSFLRDADEKRRGDGRVAQWVRDMREVAYDVEDIVDSFILKMHRQHRHGFKGFIKRYICIIQEHMVNRNTRTEIKKIKEKLQTISTRKAFYDINANVDANQGRSLTERIMKERRELPIRRDMDVFVGFEDDMEKILEILLDEAKYRRYVISIVGMGGSGKTTLARRICNHDSVKMSFGGHCALVSVSQTYTAHKILEDIAKDFLDKEDMQRMDERAVEEKLYKFLRENKYLIVLDDVWGTEVWGLIRPQLPDAMNGSRVIITTRSMNVARSAEPSILLHELRLLRNDESWDLFTKIVFPGEDDMNMCRGELKQLGENIIKRCGGLPLAINVMGGLLSMKDKIPSVWRNVLQGIDWDKMPEGDLCMQILALSYKDLPPHLKPCFMYLSCFREDQEIDAEKLVHLWIAEGFIPQKEVKQDRQGVRMLEDVAEDWLDDLIQRSMLQVAKRNYSGRVVACRVHDLLLELSIKEAEAANFLQVSQEVERLTATDTTRRLAVHPGTTSKGYTSKDKGLTSQEFSAPKLRTFLLLGLDLSECPISLQFLKRTELLRVLDLEDAGCLELPWEIGDLIHLRYLGLKNNKLKSIPSSVVKLHNLLTMDVRGNLHLKGLPDKLWEITNLRHMFVEGRIDPPMACSRLTNLQTLLAPAAGSWIEEGLVKMTRIRSLGINRILPGHHHPLAKSLDSLVHLRSLRLEGEYNDRGALSRGPLPGKALTLPGHSHLQELILWGPLQYSTDGDQLPLRDTDLPQNLSELALWDSQLQQDPLSLLRNLPYLRRLRLRNAYVGRGMVCSAGGFPQLEQLELRWLGIWQWKVENGAMPRLKNLEIYFCHQLEMLPEGMVHLKALQTLEIGFMPDEFTKRYYEGGEDHYKIRHIPSVKIITN